MFRKSFLTRNVVILSIVSFFTDVASEMLYPIMPLYLKEIGYGALALGFIEGIAETISGITKVFFGHLSDQTGKRTVFVRAGYMLSSLSKPFIGLIQNGYFIFFIRLLDRSGKGIRTAPRDTIITSEVVSAERGRAFGFHRGMDSLGATVGPIISLIFLSVWPNQYTLLFFIAFIPGIIATASTYLVKEPKPTDPGLLVDTKTVLEPHHRHSLSAFISFFRESTPMYRRIVIGLFLMALLNSSNMFLILRSQEMGLSDSFTLISYIVYNAVFTLISLPVGYLIDRYGYKRWYCAGIVIFGLSYGLFAHGFGSPVLVMLTFVLYGIFAAIEENTSKAWLSQHLLPHAKATGFGLSLSVNALAFLIGSLTMGFLWNKVGSGTAFSLVSLSSVVVVIYFVVFVRQPKAAISA